MNKKVLMILFTCASIANIQSVEVHSKCYERYCYFWNGEKSNYTTLKPCPGGYWTLEIYDEEVKNEVDGFIDWLIRVKSEAITNYYVPLNISCESSTECTWNHANKRADYMFFMKESVKTKKNHIYMFQIKHENQKWLVAPSNHNFLKVCMKENDNEIQTSVARSETGSPVTTDQTGEAFFVMLVLAVTTTFVVIIGIILFIIFRKRNRPGNVNPMTNDDSATHSNKIIETSTEKSLYSQVMKADETTSNQNDCLLQYADINFCSKVDANENKMVEIQGNNYLGPMGDVYAAVQKH